MKPTEKKNAETALKPKGSTISMRPSEEVASEVMARCIGENGGENVAYYLMQAIEAARREGAEEMRERAALEADEDLWATRELSRIIRNLSLVPEGEKEEVPNGPKGNQLKR